MLSDVVHCPSGEDEKIHNMRLATSDARWAIFPRQKSRGLVDCFLASSLNEEYEGTGNVPENWQSKCYESSDIRSQRYRNGLYEPMST